MKEARQREHTKGLERSEKNSPLVVVPPDVVLQVALSRELFGAVGLGALVRLFPGVDSLVGFEVALFGERLGAPRIRTLEGPFAGLGDERNPYVGAHVDLESADARVLPPTIVAFVRLLASVRQRVALEMSFCDEALGAAREVADEGSLSGLANSF